MKKGFAVIVGMLAYLLVTYGYLYTVSADFIHTLA